MRRMSARKRRWTAYAARPVRSLRRVRRIFVRALGNPQIEAAQPPMRETAASAGAARPAWAGRIKKVVGADRPPRVRRPGVGGEDQEFIVAVDANPGDHDRQVARALRLASNSLCGEPKTD